MPDSAVVFRNEDYASFGRRVVASLIDAGLILAVAAGLQLGFALKYVPPDVKALTKSPEQQKLINKFMAPHMSKLAILDFAAFGIYFLLVRSLPGGGIGYRIAGIRLVNAFGRPASWWQLLKRLIIICIQGFIAFLPFAIVTGPAQVKNPLIQLLFLLACTTFAMLLIYRSSATRPRRQATHDQRSGTWMIRKNAIPAGPAKTFFHTIFLGTFPVRHIDVEPIAPDGLSDSPPPAARPIGEAHPPITAEAR